MVNDRVGGGGIGSICGDGYGGGGGYGGVKSGWHSLIEGEEKVIEWFGTEYGMDMDLNLGTCLASSGVGMGIGVG